MKTEISRRHIAAASLLSAVLLVSPGVVLWQMAYAAAPGETSNVIADAPWRVVYGSFANEAAARDFVKQLATKGVHLTEVLQHEGRWLVVTPFSFTSEARAQEWIAEKKQLTGLKLLKGLPLATSENVGDVYRRKAPSASARQLATGQSAPVHSAGDRWNYAEKPASVAPSAPAAASSTTSHFYATESRLRVEPGITVEQPPHHPTDSERYAHTEENRFHDPKATPLSTFSIDVDTASWSNIRRVLLQGQAPQPEAVRIEEMINSFDYNYPAPTGSDPLAVSTEVGQCPWNLEHRLVRVAVNTERLAMESRPPSNLVFLLDVSGSMNSPDKLPLLTDALNVLVRQLDERDTVSVVVYAGSSGLVLPPTSGDHKAEITEALQRLAAGGSTNGGAGIQLAYAAARESFVDGGINRVFLCTDGDFNVGVTSDGGLVELVKKEAADGVFLTVLGFGSGNLNDAMMEQITNNGNGNYAYIDSMREAQKVLGRNVMGTMNTVARDVKIQVEFNPQRVESYRLIGYDNRRLAAEDFNDDRKDAGEIGSGHAVTALYEVVPKGLASDDTPPPVDPLKYQSAAPVQGSNELMTVKVRYKPMDGDESRLISRPVADRVAALTVCSNDFVWAASVASFGLVLRKSDQPGLLQPAAIAELAEAAKGSDPHGDRAEFLDLVNRYRELEKQ